MMLLESLGLASCQQTGRLGRVEIESINSLFLPAGRQGGQGQNLLFFIGVIQFNKDLHQLTPIKKITPIKIDRFSSCKN